MEDIYRNGNYRRKSSHRSKHSIIAIKEITKIENAEKKQREWKSQN